MVRLWYQGEFIKDNQHQPDYLSPSPPQVIATCICLSLSAYVTLALHFAPKLYIIIFQPHKNDRSFFTTASKDVRCHIGRGQSTGTKTKSSINGDKISSVSGAVNLNNCVKWGDTESSSVGGNYSNCRSTDEKSTSNEIKRSETLGSNISRHTDSSKSQLSKLSVGRLVSTSGQDGDSQTEEFRLWCANCDAKVSFKQGNKVNKMCLLGEGLPRAGQHHQRTEEQQDERPGGEQLVGQHWHQEHRDQHPVWQSREIAVMWGCSSLD